MKFFHKLKKLIVFIVIVFIIFFVLFFLDTFFKIKEIQIESDNKKILGIEKLIDKNIFLLNEDVVTKQILKENPLIKSIKINKQLPSKIILSVEFSFPQAQIITGDGFFYIDDRGKVIKKTKEKLLSLPLINFYQKIYYQNYQIGQIIDFNEIKIGLFLLKKTTDLGLKINRLDIGGDNMLVFYLDNKKIIFDSLKDKEIQAYQLEQIIKSFKIQGKDYQEIDLRFEKPVVRF